MLCLPSSFTEMGHQRLGGLVSTTVHPALVLGDFNAHSQTWGCRDTNAQGRCIEDFMLKHNVCISSTGNPTYFHPGTGSLSAIDLSLCHPSLYRDLSWSVHEDLCATTIMDFIKEVNFYHLV